MVDLKIGDKVYTFKGGWTQDTYNIGVIVEETKKYFRVKFGNLLQLFDKETLRLRGSDNWHVCFAAPLTADVEERIRQQVKDQKLNKIIFRYWGKKLSFSGSQKEDFVKDLMKLNQKYPGVIRE